MKLTRHALLSGLALALAIASPYSWANQNPSFGCFWQTGSGQMILRMDLGTLYVPRDAPAGTPIGPIDKRYTQRAPGAAIVYCKTHENAMQNLIFQALATAPVFPGTLPPVGGEDVTGKILQTNIAGVGVRIRLGDPFVGGARNSFTPTEGHSVVPYQAERTPTSMLSPIPITGLISYLTLVKTGPIPAGAHSLDGSELFSGHVPTLDRIFNLGLTGTVVQAQCSVNANPVSADPVRLGDWSTTDFTGPGFTTPAVPFKIALTNCETDPDSADFAMAHIRLDGINGSQPVGPPGSGVFSLTSDSSAQGVGIQVLKADGSTPVELNTEVPLVPVASGNMTLDFNARFYQIEPSDAVRPGLAKGALSFTLTYK